MRGVAAGIALGLFGMSLALAQREGAGMARDSVPRELTRDYLLAHAFKEVGDHPVVYRREHVTLRDVAHDLGFSPQSLLPALNLEIGVSCDERWIEVRGANVTVWSEVRSEAGDIVKGSLDKPDAVCTVEVIFIHRREYLKTDKPPSIRIRSVALPTDPSKPPQVMFEFAATGKKPVAALRNSFYAFLTGGDLRPDPVCSLSFPHDTPGPITVSPGKPIVLNVTLLTVAHRLPPGRYDLRIKLGEFKSRGPQCFDYEWEGQEHWSDHYKFIIK